MSNLLDSFCQFFSNANSCSPLWTVLERISTVASIVTLILAAVGFFWALRWRKNALKKAKANVAAAPEAVLIINISDDPDMHNKVIAYVRENIPSFKNDEKLITDPCHMQEVFIRRNTSDNPATATDMAALRKKLTPIRRQFAQAGIGHIHLFLRGPLPSAAIVGDELANHYTIIFHVLQGGAYVCWGDV